MGKIAREIYVQRQKELADEVYLYGLLHNIGSYSYWGFWRVFSKHNNRFYRWTKSWEWCVNGILC